MKQTLTLIVLTALLGAAGCRVKDVRTTVISAPGIRCEECAGRVRAALENLDGVKNDSLEFDTARGAVSLRYDSMIVAIKNIEFAVAEAGYDVEAKPFPIPAAQEARAALPEACREHLD